MATKYVLQRADGSFMTQMGYMPSKEHAMRFETPEDAQRHQQLNASHRNSNVMAIEWEDDPRHHGSATMDYNPYGIDRVR